MNELIKELIEKAAKAHTSAEAMHYSQAALNAANALAVLKNTDANYGGVS